jgi:hypothetical protein
VSLVDRLFKFLEDFEQLFESEVLLIALIPLGEESTPEIDPSDVHEDHLLLVVEHEPAMDRPIILGFQNIIGDVNPVIWVLLFKVNNFLNHGLPHIDAIAHENVILNQLQVQLREHVVGKLPFCSLLEVEEVSEVRHPLGITVDFVKIGIDAFGLRQINRLEECGHRHTLDGVPDVVL